MKEKANFPFWFITESVDEEQEHHRREHVSDRNRKVKLVSLVAGHDSKA